MYSFFWSFNFPFRNGHVYKNKTQPKTSLFVQSELSDIHFVELLFFSLLRQQITANEKVKLYFLWHQKQ